MMLVTYVIAAYFTQCLKGDWPWLVKELSEIVGVQAFKDKRLPTFTKPQSGKQLNTAYPE